MARPRTRYKYEIPGTVVEIVRGLCADYERRELAIKYSTISGETLQRYVELNGAIELALGNMEASIREDMLADVAAGRGYDFSPCSVFVAKNTYYERKRRFVFDVAKKLSLVP